MNLNSYRFCSIVLMVSMLLVSCAGGPVNPSPPSAVQGVPEASAPPEHEFVLGPGDEVSVNVWRNEDLKRKLKVDPSGKVYPPLIGEMDVRGMTLSQFRDELVRGFSEYIKEPIVDISLETIVSQRIHILGEVRDPGTLTIQNPMMIWEAISRSKGFTNNANREHALIIRDAGGPSAKAILVDLTLDDLVNSGIVSKTLFVYPGDIVYIPETSIAGFETFMIRLKNIIAPFLSVERGIVLGKEAFDVLKGQHSGGIIVAP